MGSIGEVIVSYYYGISLYKASIPTHDGVVDGKKVQIKITQQENIGINEEPEYLLVLYLTKKGDVYEVYNGRGKAPWESASKSDRHNNRHMRVNKLMELDATILSRERIIAKKPIEKMRKEYKNKKK